MRPNKRDWALEEEEGERERIRERLERESGRKREDGEKGMRGVAR